MKYSVFSGVLPELDAEQAAEAVRRNGYDGIEWRVNGEYHFKEAEIDRVAPRIKAISEAAGLEVCGLTTYVRLDQEDSIKRLADAANIIGCPRFRLFSALYDPKRGYRAIYDDTVEKLKRVEALLKGRGVKALLEIHFGTIVCSPSLAYDVVRHCDPAVIGVIHDPANTIIEGGMNPRMGLDIVKDYVDLVHVKNVRWERTADGTWRWRFDELADGALDWRETVSALKDAGYDGYFSFENLYRVPVQHRGYVAEDISDTSLPPRDIDARLSGDLAYMRALVESA